MRVLFLYPRSTTNSGSSAFDWLCQSAELFGMELQICFFEDVSLVYGALGEARLLISGVESALPDVALLRGYNLALGRHLELFGVRVLNPSDAMENSRNKLLTHQILSRSGLPTPSTIYSSEYDYRWVAHQLGSPFIAKTIVGSKGEGVYLVDSEQELDRLQTLHEPGSLLVQNFISTSKGRDIRVWVIGDRVAGAVLRYNPNSYLSNYAQGGSVAPIEITPQIETLAIQSTQALGLDFAGVDILMDNQNYTICEVNANAGFRTHSLLNPDQTQTIPYQLFKYIKSLEFNKKIVPSHL